MKLLKSFFSVVMAIVIIGIFAGCASTGDTSKASSKASTAKAEQKNLTQTAIYADIIGDEDIANLASSQFFLSKDIQLHWTATERAPAGVKNKGTVQVLNTTTNDDVVIKKSSKGILYKYASTGALTDVLRTESSIDGNDMVVIGIIFGKNNDEYLEFAAFAYDDPDGKFELVKDINNKVLLGDRKYTVSYEGTELPYLQYKVVEKSVAKTTKRTFSGRDAR